MFFKRKNGEDFEGREKKKTQVISAINLVNECSTLSLFFLEAT